MTTSRQPKGIPVGGQFAATTHAEPETGLYPVGSIGDRLANAKSALSVYTAEWNAEAEEMRQQSNARRKRHARVAGVRSATMILEHLPEADVLTYTRTPVMGMTSLLEVRDVDGNVIYNDDDLNNPLTRAKHYEETERRAAIREAVRILAGADMPPEHEAQGITVHSDHEQLHLPTALDDGIATLGTEPTPAQASKRRVEAALSQWNDQGEDLQTRVRDMLTDLRHFAAEHDVDLGEAMDHSYEVFADEHNDPTFKEGF